MISLLYGANGYKKLAELHKITDGVDSHSIERRDGEDLGRKDLLDLFQGVSLFTAEKLVIIRDLSKNKPMWEFFGESLDTIPDETHIVLLETAPDKRTRTFKQLQKKARVIACEELNDNHIIEWLITEAKARNGTQLDRKLAGYLLRRVGNNQSRLSTELDKIILLEPPLTERSMNEAVEASPEGNAFDLLDAALAKRQAQVRQHIASLRFMEDPYRLFGLLTSQVFTLALVYAGKGVTPDELAKQASVHPFVARKLAGVTRTMNDQEMVFIANEVAVLDDRLKTSGGDPWDLLEHALLKISAR